MDYQQALDFFKEEIKGGFCSPDCKDYQSVLVAIKAIEKQIPKKIKAAKEPIKADIQVLYWTTYECPICGGIFTGRGLLNYCSYCGQSFKDAEMAKLFE